MAARRRRMADRPEGEPPARRARMDPNLKTLMILPDEVVEDIMRRLDINELINFSRANKRLLSIARSLYGRKYKNTTVIFLIGDESYSFFIKRDGRRDIIRKRNLAHFIWYFKSLITSVIVQCNSRIRNQEHITLFEQLFISISKNLKALKNIALNSFPEGHLQRFLKPLPQVRSVAIRRSDLSGNEPFLKNSFKNIEQLVIEDGHMHTLIEHKLSRNLKYMTLVVSVQLNINISHFKTFLLLNPGLYRFKLEGDHVGIWELVQFIADYANIMEFELISELEPPEKIFHFNKNIIIFRYRIERGNCRIKLTNDKLRNVSVRSLYDELKLNTNQ